MRSRLWVTCPGCPWKGSRVKATLLEPCPKCGSEVKRMHSWADRRSQKAKADLARYEGRGE